jgi:hypothetical protein
MTIASQTETQTNSRLRSLAGSGISFVAAGAILYGLAWTVFSYIPQSQRRGAISEAIAAGLPTFSYETDSDRVERVYRINCVGNGTANAFKLNLTVKGSVEEDHYPLLDDNFPTTWCNKASPHYPSL